MAAVFLNLDALSPSALRASVWPRLTQSASIPTVQLRFSICSMPPPTVQPHLVLLTDFAQNDWLQSAATPFGENVFLTAPTAPPPVIYNIVSGCISQPSRAR